MSATFTHQQMQLQQQQQHSHKFAQQKVNVNTGSNEKAIGKPRLVASGKCYRQLFEAQVQLGDAYDKVKEKLRENPPQERVTAQDGIPLVKEGRGLRGNGILTQDGKEWVNANTNELFVQNPLYLKHLSDEKKVKLGKLKKLHEKEEVNVLPDEVVAGSKGSNIETKIQDSRRKKHNETWEDMIQEIALVNLKLEPEIKKTGRIYLAEIAEDDAEIVALLNNIYDDELFKKATIANFDEYNKELMSHSDKRKEFIDKMDETYHKIENDRVENIRSIFNDYAEKLFRINFLPRPEIEKLLDAELQQLNSQIIINKRCYAQLYAKLITADIEREKTQLLRIEQRFNVWSNYVLNEEIKNLERYIENFDMLSSSSSMSNTSNETNVSSVNFEDELFAEQKKYNDDRILLLETIKGLKPPDSTKISITKWQETLQNCTKLLDDTNSKYVTKLRLNYEESNQKIINKMEDTLAYLINSRIIEGQNSKEILEKKLLPIWSKKQKLIEEYIENVENEFEELSQITNKEMNNLLKYLQAVCHIWDTHELGLVKKERSLQELLQDCRRDHDNDNQKREEKLDSILDQMREASNEKDLKRLLNNVALQLDAIKRGYNSFKDSQYELIKQYPQMIKEELIKYRQAVLRHFGLVNVNNKTPSTARATQNADYDNQNQTERSNNASALDEDLNMTQIDIEKCEILTSEHGVSYYILNKQNEFPNNEEVNMMNGVDILTFDEIIPNTKNNNLINEVESRSYLRCIHIPIEIYKDIRTLVRLNFINHLETWLEEANVRSSSIIAAKSEEIDKELELRLHLHEPRMKRAEMDVHNVRAAELIIHDERVERHCAGILDAIEQTKKDYEATQNKLNEMAEQNKSDIMQLEIAFTNATKSFRLVALQEQLSKKKDKHIEDVKATLRNFRAKFDDTLQFLRSSNAKFRFSFNVFSDGGNFSADEIEAYKKKLEKMAIAIDANETNLLKDLEKLEKKHLDEAIKVLSQFQEKFKYHLVDLKFIEKITRWLSETQIKIKTDVAESNMQAKNLNKKIIEFEFYLKEFNSTSFDKKINLTSSDLLDHFDEINRLVYERGAYLRCFKDEMSVPIEFRPIQQPKPQPVSASEKLPLTNEKPHQDKHHVSSNSNAKLDKLTEQSEESLSVETANVLQQIEENQSHTSEVHNGDFNNTASSAIGLNDPNMDSSNANINANKAKRMTSSFYKPSKTVSEDSALTIMKNILHNVPAETSAILQFNRELNQEGGEEQLEEEDEDSRLSNHKPIQNRRLSAAQNRRLSTMQRRYSKAPQKVNKKKQSTVTPAPNKVKTPSNMSSKAKLLTIAEVNKIIEERRSKTRDEMYAYYCTFGEAKHLGNDFISKISNILRDSLEGILTNSEVFYKEVHIQNRQITRLNLIKESYPEFAEAIISKLKSYLSQCQVYQNQCLKEFRECLTKYEMICASLPELIISDLYAMSLKEFNAELEEGKNRNIEIFNQLEKEKEAHESALRPNLGHPNMMDKLASLNEAELRRQDIYNKAIAKFLSELRSIVRRHADNFYKKLSNANESLMLKFDDMLCIDDVNKHEMIAEKHQTSELIRRQLAGLSLEDPEPEPLIKREKGKWNGIESYNSLFAASESKKQEPNSSATINTLKTTLAHKNSSESVIIYNQKFKKDLEENLKYVDKTQKELTLMSSKWTSYWAESVVDIKKLYI